MGMETDMSERISGYNIQLCLFASSVTSPREQAFIRSLEDLLDACAEGQEMDQKKLGKAQYRMSTVPCWAERYLHIVEFLKDYSYLSRLRTLYDPSSAEQPNSQE